MRHAYLLHQGNFASFDAPGAIETRSLVVNNLGVIGGTFLDSGGVRKAVFVCFLILIPCSLHAQDKKGDLQAP